MFRILKLQYARYKTLSAYRKGSWKDIKIIENLEPLLKVPESMAYPYYHLVLGLPGGSEIILRQSVLEKVISADEKLRKLGYELKVYDGWRSIERQEHLFWYYMKKFTAPRFGVHTFDHYHDILKVKEQFEEFSPDMRVAMIEANLVYVSLPSSDPLRPSPHSTGGAVDVWPYRDGQAVNLGVPFDWMELNARSFYHLKFKKERFRGNNKRICRDRENLILAMVDAGFSCYGPEFWHYNFGNQMDALVKGGYAIYGYAKP